MTKTPELDAEMISRTRAQMRAWRAAVEAANNERAKLNQMIVDLKKSGHSYSQIREVTDFGTATIQMILAKAGYSE